MIRNSQRGFGTARDDYENRCEYQFRGDCLRKNSMLCIRELLRISQLEQILDVHEDSEQENLIIITRLINAVVIH